MQTTPTRKCVPRSTNMHPLAVARRQKGLSVRELAAAIDTPKMYANISAWEHGRALPSWQMARKLAAVLDFASGEELLLACEAWQNEFLLN